MADDAAEDAADDAALLRGAVPASSAKPQRVASLFVGVGQRHLWMPGSPKQDLTAYRF